MAIIKQLTNNIKEKLYPITLAKITYMLDGETVEEKVTEIDANLKALCNTITDITILSTDWVNNVYIIRNALFKANSVIDIYYSSDSLTKMATAKPTYLCVDGELTITATVTLLENVKIDAIKVVNVIGS